MNDHVEVSAMRPRLRPDLFWVVTEKGGVHGIGCRGRYSLQGGDVHRWIERLAPFLDGTQTVRALTKSLVPERRAHVEEIVGRLHDNGLVEDLERERPHTLGEEEVRLYTGQIAHIAQFAEAAAHRFEHYRNRHVLVLGTGVWLLELVDATVRSGCRRLTVVADSGEDAAHRALLRQILAEANDRDPYQTATLVDLDRGIRADDRGRSDDDDERGAVQLGRLLDKADVALQLSSSTAHARTLERLCARQGKIACQAMVDGGEAWIGPVNDPAIPGPTWESAWRRLARPDGFAAQRTPPVEPERAPAALAAHLLVLRCFHHLTGVVVDRHRRGDSMIAIDLARLSTSVHHFAPHPLAAPACARTGAQLRSRIAELQQRADVDDRAFGLAAAACVDPRLGILLTIDERHFQQLPLWVVEARASDPVGILAARGISGAVHGAALDFATARHRAARRALELYSSAMLDRRRILAPGSAAGGWLWGWRLDQNNERLVPVDAVFTTTDGVAGACPDGVASGTSWAAAVETSLVRRCCALTVTGAIAATRPYPEVDLDLAPLDPVGRRLVAILRLAGAQVAARDITGPLELPVFSFHLGDRTVAYAAAWASADALRDGLEQVLLAHQAAMAGEPEYDPPRAPPLPAHSVRGDLPTHPGPETSRPAWLEDRANRTIILARAVAQRGGVAVAVPLDHDPALEAALPFAVRVVIVD